MLQTAELQGVGNSEPKQSQHKLNSGAKISLLPKLC